jgi:ubiquinone biosynthesis monooxygenase Coq7
MSDDTHAMIRVDQAGEYGAARIYAGQLAILGDRHPLARPIARMKAQEQRHLDEFNALMAMRGVRPTLLQPLWHVAGYALGMATALLGPQAAMAGTAAVETEIDAHYGAQRRELGDDDPALAAMIADFQAEEAEHHDTAIEHGAENTPGYALLAGVIRLGCRAAIAVSTRI